MTLDSAQTFNQDNYKGKIREVVLREEPESFSFLKDALEHARKSGYTPKKIEILNVVWGESARNEPTRAILMEYRGIDALEESLIIERDNFRFPYEFYGRRGFRFLS